MLLYPCKPPYTPRKSTMSAENPLRVTSTFLHRTFRPKPNRTPSMISDVTLTNITNGLGVAAMACIVLYHFVAVNGKRMEQGR